MVQRGRHSPPNTLVYATDTDTYRHVIIFVFWIAVHTYVYTRIIFSEHGITLLRDRDVWQIVCGIGVKINIGIRQHVDITHSCCIESRRNEQISQVCVVAY